MAFINTSRSRLLIDFSFRGVRCREYVGLQDTKDGRAKAKQIRIQIEAELVAGTFEYVKWFPNSKKVRPGGPFAPPLPHSGVESPTFGAFSREWLGLQRPFGSRATHLDRKSLLESKLIPFFTADKIVSTFTVEDVERLIGKLTLDPGLKDEHLSPRRINLARDLLGRILDRCVKNGWLRENPAHEVKRLRESRSEVDPLSLDEVKALLRKGFTDPEMRRFYTVAIWTGLRTSELIGLKWADLDWTTRPPTAMIKRSLTKLDGEHPTKTPGSARPVDLRPPAERAILGQQAASRLKSEYIFYNAGGGPLDRDNLNNRVWKPAVLRAKLRERSPYQCRHTFATIALSAGEEIGWVARQMGHESSEMVVRHYYRWIRNNTRQDGAALDRLLQKHGLDR